MKNKDYAWLVAVKMQSKTELFGFYDEISAKSFMESLAAAGFEVAIAKNKQPKQEATWAREAEVSRQL